MVGRKRHIVVDMLGLVGALVITPANVHDVVGGRMVLAACSGSVQLPLVIWVEQAYPGLVG